MRYIAVVVAVLFAGCGAPQAPQKASSPATGNDEPVKILAFYPRDPVVIEGGKTVLCYGVSNAKSVRIDPPVDGVSPTRTRCVEIQPKRETLYTLTAEGSDGKSVSQSFTVRIGTDQAALPRISSFKIEAGQKDYTGRTVFTLSFADQNGEEISIDPPVFPPLHGAPSGQFSVRPEKTTTYTLTVKGKNGHVARQQVTVEVPVSK